MTNDFIIPDEENIKDFRSAIKATIHSERPTH